MEKTDKKENYSKAFLDLPVLIYVLKWMTDKDNPSSVPNIAREMQSIMGEKYSVRTLQRRMAMLEDATDWEKEMNLGLKEAKKRMFDLLEYVFAGRIKHTESLSSAKKPRRQYYFEACLDSSAMRMLNGSVISNIFLSEEEKRLLLSRLSIINKLDTELEAPEDSKDNFTGSDKTEYGSEFTDFPGDTNRFLHNLSIIDNAVRKGYQIIMTYGTYDLEDGEITYHERKGHKYRLNPYAHFWSGGHYYMLATYVKDYKPKYVKEEGTPINFRLDRVIKVGYVRNKESAGFKKREAIPSRLNPFFVISESDPSVYDFDSLKYSKTFPFMRISGHKKPVTCHLECTSWSLQILIDTFGTVINVQESTKKHGSEDLDYNGRAQKYIEAVIENVEFENIRDFCLAHPEYITPTEPPELVEAVKNKLEKILEKYK